MPCLNAAAASSEASPSPFLAPGIIQSAIELGSVEEHLTRCVRPSLAARCAALCSALSTSFPEASFVVPQVRESLRAVVLAACRSGFTLQRSTDAVVLAKAVGMCANI
jgi:hypothetical protein